MVQHLRAHWHDRELSAERIAAEHHISTRHLYRLSAAWDVHDPNFADDEALTAADDACGTKT